MRNILFLGLFFVSFIGFSQELIGSVNGISHMKINNESYFGYTNAQYNYLKQHKIFIVEEVDEFYNLIIENIDCGSCYKEYKVKEGNLKLSFYKVGKKNYLSIVHKFEKDSYMLETLNEKQIKKLFGKK